MLFESYSGGECRHHCMGQGTFNVYIRSTSCQCSNMISFFVTGTVNVLANENQKSIIRIRKGSHNALIEEELEKERSY